MSLSEPPFGTYFQFEEKYTALVYIVVRVIGRIKCSVETVVLQYSNVEELIENLHNSK